MNIKERSFNVTLKATKNYNSAAVTEGLTVLVDDQFNELDWEVMKQEVKDKLTEEVKKLLETWDVRLKHNEYELIE